VKVDTGDDPSARVTHLVVAKGERRTLRVMFALVQQSFCVGPEFLGMALDGALGSEKECRVSGREWDPREERQSCLEGKTVYLDPDLLDPPAATMRKLIILAGGAVSSRRDTATLHIASSKVKFGPSRVLGEDATTQITMSPAQLFDAIEAALSPTQRPSTDR